MKKLKHLCSIAMLCAAAPSLQAQTYTDGDITLEHNIGMAHDSTTCLSNVSGTYQITVQNSFLNDTVRIIDNVFQTLYYQEVNTNGNNPWIVYANIPFLSAIVPDHLVVNNMVNFFAHDIKVVHATDTIITFNNIWMLPVPDPCEYGSLTGRVYVDNNADCTYNTGDSTLQVLPITVRANLNNTMLTQFSPLQGSLVTGQYTAQYVQQSWMNDYDVYMNPYFGLLYLGTVCTPMTYNYTTLPQTNVDFVLQCASNVDVMAFSSAPQDIRPGIPFMLHPTASNMGCEHTSGTLTLVLDPEVTYDPSQTFPTPNYVSTTNDTLVWNYADLTNISNGAFWNSFITGVHLTPNLTLNIGDTACFRVYTEIPINDIDPVNNDYSFCLPVVNSYDPNIKEVTPAGEGPLGNILPGTDELTYTIHFQNTGNAAAINIAVLDTLDADIDPATFKIIGNSHNMVPEFLAPNIIKFRFDNIMLPDSNTNEPASHGSVTYKVKLDPNLPLGTQITNTAHIFFDFNPAIVTNTVINTIALPTAISNMDAAANISVFPNPASDNIFISSKDALEGKAYLSNVSGQLISTVSLSGNSTKIDVSKLPAGIYMLKMVSTTGTSMQKFTKQ